jgi:predicted enzyme related to lactoylglutathione lyase
MISNVDYLGIVVTDIDSATTFYRDTLGFVVDEAESVPSVFVQFKRQGGALLALMKRDLLANQPFEPGFLVEDVDATYAAWKARDVEIVEDINDKPFGRTFVFRAPQGHMFRVFTLNSKGQ